MHHLLFFYSKHLVDTTTTFKKCKKNGDGAFFVAILTFSHHVDEFLWTSEIHHTMFLPLFLCAIESVVHVCWLLAVVSYFWRLFLDRFTEPVSLHDVVYSSCCVELISIIITRTTFNIALCGATTPSCSILRILAEQFAI